MGPQKELVIVIAPSGIHHYPTYGCCFFQQR